MNSLHEAYIKTMCLKHGVQHDSLHVGINRTGNDSND